MQFNIDFCLQCLIPVMFNASIPKATKMPCYFFLERKDSRARRHLYHNIHFPQWLLACAANESLWEYISEINETRGPRETYETVSAPVNSLKNFAFQSLSPASARGQC